MDQQGRLNEPQLAFRRDPETGQPVIPHFCENRPDFAPIHARAETVAENEWLSDAYQKWRCVVSMESFIQKDGAGKRYAISRRDCQPFGVAAIWENWRNPLVNTWERAFAVIIVTANARVGFLYASRKIERRRRQGPAASDYGTCLRLKRRHTESRQRGRPW